MTTRTATILLAAFMLTSAAGCRSHTIRPGIWELRFNAVDSSERVPVELDPYDVRVLVDWADDGGEDVELEKLGSSVRRLYGKIQPAGSQGAPAIIDLRSQEQTDPLWMFRLQGDVVSDDRVKGTVFMARHRESRETALEGRWGMFWKSD